MSIYRKGNTFFTIFRLPGSRKQYSEKLRSRNITDAKKEDRAREVERDRLWKDGKVVKADDMPWKALVDRYLDISEGNGNCPATLKRKRLHFQTIDELMEIKMVSGWTVDALEDLKLRARRAGSAPGTINKHLVYVKCVLRLARRLKLKTLSSDDVYEVSQMRNTAAEPPYFMIEEQIKLLEIASSLWRVAILLAALAGLRRGEVLGLRWSEVNFARREMAILDRPDRRTKTRISKTIPLHPVLVRVLEEWRAENPQEEMVFPWRKYEDPEKNANEFSHAFKRLCNKAGVDGSFKALRHGFASGLLQVDVNISKIQKILGHKSVKTTQRYSHVRTPDLPDAINKLPSPLPMGVSNQASNQQRNFRQSGELSTNINNDGRTA